MCRHRARGTSVLLRERERREKEVVEIERDVENKARDEIDEKQQERGGGHDWGMAKKERQREVEPREKE